MSQAVVGLIGVVVGGVLQASGTWLMARRGDHQQARAASRLTAGELMRASLKASRLLNARSWEELTVRPFDITRWTVHEARFAATVTDDEKWAEIHNAYLTLTQLNEYATEYLADGLPRPLGLSTRDVEELERAVQLALDAAAAMTFIAYYGPGRWSVRRGTTRVRGWWRVHVRRLSDDQIMEEVEAEMDPRLPG